MYPNRVRAFLLTGSSSGEDVRVALGEGSRRIQSTAKTSESNGQKNIHARSIRECSTVLIFFPRSRSRTAKLEDEKEFRVTKKERQTNEQRQTGKRERERETWRGKERKKSGRRRKVFEERSNLESFCSMTFRDNKLSPPHYPQMRL